MAKKETTKLYRHWKAVISTQLDLIANLVKEHEPKSPNYAHYGHVGDLTQASTALDTVIGHFEQVDDYDSMDRYDTVRVHFKDGTSTVIYVLEDDDIRDTIVEMCEAEGYHALDVTDYKIV